MNAIILAGGHSSRMKASNQFTHKPLLTINRIPNIERTIIMLRDFGITEIIVVAGIYAEQYRYLINKYNCTIISDPSTSISTLYGIYNVLEKICDTFIIEGDVVLAENVFKYDTNSFYYVMRYPDCDSDAWKPILNEKGHIVSFEIGCFSEPCIFGISFWCERDSEYLKQFIKSICTKENLENNEKFWDDYFTEILCKIPIYTYEISSTSATEMNNSNQYNFAIQLCQCYYSDLSSYILNLNDIENKYSFIQNEEMAKNYTKKLWLDYNTKHLDNPQNIDEIIEFKDNEYPFIIKKDKLNIAFIDLILEKNYILLRRIYVDELYRNQSVGTQIIKRVITLSKLINKDLRVNVYDIDAARFYKRLGFKFNFENYYLRGNDYGYN